MPENKRKYTKKATTQQLTALKLINEGVEPTKAMLRAGYSPSTARNPKKKLMQSQAITSIVDKFHLQLQDEGLTTAYLAKKFKFLLDADAPIITMAGPLLNPITKEPIMKPLHKVQLEALKMLKDIYGLQPASKSDPNVKRKIELTEFING